jgi:hypothetical protein
VSQIDHVQLVKALSDPAFYPHPVDKVRFLQTHISSVFLTGEYVFTLKTSLNFGFPDFSTLERRKINCRADLEPPIIDHSDSFLPPPPMFQRRSPEPGRGAVRGQDPIRKRVPIEVD